MFNEDETKDYGKLFEKIGLTDKSTQEKVLTFLYTLGTIMYNNISF